MKALGIQTLGDHSLLEMGGTIATRSDGTVDGESLLEPADSSQLTRAHLGYLLKCAAVYTHAQAEGSRRPLLIKTGTDTMAPLAYFLSLCLAGVPKGRISLVGSMYHLEHPKFDGRDNYNLAKCQKSAPSGPVSAVVDRHIYPGALMQKQRNDLLGPAFGQPVTLERGAKPAGSDGVDAYEGAVTTYLESLTAVDSQDPLAATQLPEVSVIGVTTKTTPAALRSFFDDYLLSDGSDSLVIYGPMTQELLAICEGYQSDLLSRGGHMVVTHTGKDCLTSDRLPLLSHKAEMSERSQLKLMWLLAIAGASDLSELAVQQFLKDHFSRPLIDEHNPVSDGYYLSQRVPEDAGLDVPIYVPRQFEMSVPLVRSVSSEAYPLVVGAFVDNLPGVGSLTPSQHRSRLFLEDEELEGRESVDSGLGLVFNVADVSDERIIKSVPMLKVLQSKVLQSKLEKRGASVSLLGSTPTRPSEGFRYAPMQMTDLLGISSV